MYPQSKKTFTSKVNMAMYNFSQKSFADRTIFFFIMFGIILIIYSIFKPDPVSLPLTDAEQLAEKHMSMISVCKYWMNTEGKLKLRDPDSYRYITSYGGDVVSYLNPTAVKTGSPKNKIKVIKFIATVEYRAKNGFGGYVGNTWKCEWTYNEATRSYS